MIESVATQFRYVEYVLEKNLEGVDHEASLRSPAPGGNCLNWIVGHLVSSYDDLLGALKVDPVLTPDQKTLYERASEPLSEASDPMTFDALREALASAQRRLQAALAELPEERLAEPATISPGANPDETVGSLLSVFAFHQAYHAGQTGLARRLVGLGNALT